MAGGAIFYRSAWVIPFRLTQECYGWQVAGERIQSQQRRIADALDQAMTERFSQSYGHFSMFLGFCREWTVLPVV